MNQFPIFFAKINQFDISYLLLQIGTYNPIPSKKDNTKEITANGERVNYWLSNGAQPSDRVAWLFGAIGNSAIRDIRFHITNL